MAGSVHRRWAVLLVGLGLALGARAAPAQQLALKRAVPTVVAGCPVLPSPAAASAERRSEAAGLAAEGNQAALLGDNREAATLLRRAAELNPADADVAYRLARAYEELEDPDAAVGEYCRYLALAPRGADLTEVRGRIAALPPSDAALRAERAADQFRAGLQAYDRGDFAAAERAFSDAIRENPELPAAYFNRAMVYAAQRQPERAAGDWERYLRLEPGAADRALVGQRLAALRPAPQYQPGELLAGALVIPGLGQFRTGRPVLGALVLGGVGGATYLALQSRTVIGTCTYTRPIGEPYEGPCPIVERPNVALGIGAATAITALGALEAFLYARRAEARRPSRPVAALVEPTADGFRVGLTVRAGRR